MYRDYRNVILSEAAYGGLPVAAWMLDEVAGTVAKAVVGAAGAYVGSPTLSVRPGPNNRSGAGWPTFNGSSQYVNAGTIGSFGSLLSSGATFECWAKTTSTAGMAICGSLPAAFANAILVAVNQNDVGGNNVGVVRAWIADAASNRLSGATTGTPWVNDGFPHHIAVCWNVAGKAITVYIDGVANSVTLTNNATLSTFANYSADVYLGARNHATVAHFAGSMANVAVYAYQLAPARIQYHYLAGKHGLPIYED
jgi:hypothetical protein